MREFIGFTVAWASAICVGCMGLDLVGFGRPNCEPTTIGYIGFYATLFGCSVASCVLAWLGLGLIIGVRNLMRAIR
jgi:hypothetical protein